MRLHRFDGRQAWRQLDPALQEKIGVMALELGVAGRQLRAVRNAPIGHIEGEDVLERALNAAGIKLADDLTGFVTGCVEIPDDVHPIPATLGPVCERCGCSEEDACEDGCSWANRDKTICTACIEVEVVS